MNQYILYFTPIFRKQIKHHDPYNIDSLVPHSCLLHLNLYRSDPAVHLSNASDTSQAA